MCCIGCRAAAEWIDQLGLADYYRLRSEPALRPAASPNDAASWQHAELDRHLVRELYRVMRPGRIVAVHCKDLVYYRTQRATAGLRDFPGGLIAAHIDAGFDFHSRITIWRCPVREMQKTKSDRLLYKNFRTDGARTGGGLPEYIVVFRKWAPGMEETPPVLHTPGEYPLEAWQHYAQPSYMVEDLWTDTDETDTLNVRIARDEDAEKHLCPMPLDLTERLIRQYTNSGETVYSPFMGVGSEGFVSLRHGRRFIGTELKPSYYRQACKYLDEAERLGPVSDLFAQAAAQ